MSTAFVPRSVKLKLLEKMKQGKLEKQKDEGKDKDINEKAEKEKALEKSKPPLDSSSSTISEKEKVLEKSKPPPDSSSSAMSDDVGKRIRRSCLQEKLFAMQCKKASKKKVEQKTSFSNSNSSDTQGTQDTQEKSSRQNYSQDASRFSNGYQEKISRHKNSQESPNSSDDYYEKPRQKLIKDIPKSSISDRQDYQEKISRQKYLQGNSKSSNPRPTPFSFSVPSDKFSPKFSYSQSNSKAESPPPIKPSFTLLKDRPLEDPGETSFFSNGCKSSDSEFPKEIKHVSSKPNGLTSFLSSWNGSNVLKSQKNLKKIETTCADVKESRKNSEVLKISNSPRKRISLTSFKEKEESEEKSLKAAESSSNFDKGNIIDTSRAKRHLNETIHDKKSREKYYESRGNFEPIDWNEIREISKQPSKPVAKENTTFTLSTDKLSARFSLGQSSSEPESPNVKPFCSILQNRFRETSTKTFFVPENFKSFNIESRKKISPASSDSEEFFEVVSDICVNKSKASSENVSEKKEKTTSILEVKSKLKTLPYQNLAEKKEKTITILGSKSKDQLKALSPNVVEKKEKTIDISDLENNNNLELEHQTSMSQKKHKKLQDDRLQKSTESNQVTQVLSSSSTSSKPLSTNNKHKKKENFGDLSNLQGFYDDKQKIKNYYESRGNFSPINWNELTRTLTKNPSDVVPKKNREPNELLKKYSSDKPDVTTETMEFFNFVDNTTDYQTIYEVKGNLERNPKAMNDPITKIQRLLHSDTWNVCYLPKEMKTVFKRSVQKSSIATQKIVVDYTQAKKTPNSLPIKAVLKTPKKSPKEIDGPTSISSINLNKQYNDKLDSTKPQALRELETTLSQASSKNYKRAVHDFTDDMFEFNIPKNTPLPSTKSKLNSSLNSTLNSTLDSDDTPLQRSSELDESATAKEPQQSSSTSKKFEALRRAVECKPTCKPISKISYVTKAEKALNIMKLNEQQLSLETKCTKYLNECVINDLAIKDKPIEIEEIKMPKVEELLLKPVSTRYFTEEQKNELIIKEKKNEQISEKQEGNSSNNLNEIPREVDSNVPQKLIEIQTKDTEEKCIDESNIDKLPQPIFSNISENNQKGNTDDDSDSDWSVTQPTGAVIHEIESDSELDNTKNTYKSDDSKTYKDNDIERYGDFDVVGDFLDYLITDTKKETDNSLEASLGKSVVKSSNSNKNPLDMLNDNIFKNVNVTEFYGSSISESINENKENIKTPASNEISNRKKKKLACLAKAKYLKTAEESKELKVV